MTISHAGHGHSKARRPIKALLIDLDDTLYRCERIPKDVRASIQRYMVDKLGVSEAEVEELTLKLYKQYGTTLAGLLASGYKVDFDEWHAYVHHNIIDYNALLKADIMLRELLCSMPDIPKYILTNADRKHANLCLARLGISDCFQGIFDFEWAMEHGAARGHLTSEHPILCKPSHSVYHLALEAINCTASEVMFFDDSARNIMAAHEVGLMTCLVGSSTLIPGADLALHTMHSLPHALPELVDQPGIVHDCHDRHALVGEMAVEEREVLPALVAVSQGSGRM